MAIILPEGIYGQTLLGLFNRHSFLFVLRFLFIAVFSLGPRHLQSLDKIDFVIQEVVILLLFLGMAGLENNDKILKNQLNALKLQELNYFSILGAKFHDRGVQVLLFPSLLFIVGLLLSLVGLDEGVALLPVLARHVIPLHFLDLASLVMLLGQVQQLSLIHI